MYKAAASLEVSCIMITHESFGSSCSSCALAYASTSYNKDLDGTATNMGGQFQVLRLPGNTSPQ